MAIATYFINKIYNEYSNIELFFNKSVINFTGLESKKIFLKVKNELWPCILYSCSMKFARVIISLDKEAFDSLNNVNNFVNLKLSFFMQGSKNSIMFYIPANVEGYRNVSEKYKNVYLVNLNFTQKPSDDLIEILGSLIEANKNFEKRANKRITLNNKIAKDIGLISNNIIAEIDMIKRSCILRNISSNGAGILLHCIPKFLMKKPIKLHLTLDDHSEIILNGILSRYDKIEGRRDIYELGIEFKEDKIPLEFKKVLNEYFKKLEHMARQK